MALSAGFVAPVAPVAHPPRLGRRQAPGRGHALAAAALGVAQAVRGRSALRAQGRPRVAVVGAGWGGLGAAKALCENGCDVTLLDGGSPGAPVRTPSGKPFEAGTRGFWRDYPNMNAILKEIGALP